MCPSANAASKATADVVNADGRGAFLFVCEHASAFIPDHFGNLGLDAQVATSHVAWDPGACEVAMHLSQLLDGPLVRSNVSRLVYDCNRPPDAPDAMPAVSEIHEIPGNRNLSRDQRAARVAQYYRPFEQLLAHTIASRPSPPVLVTVHTFTPIFKGVARSVEIGVLHDRDTRMADAMLSIGVAFDVRRNEPYGPEDGVTHTLRRHGMENGLLNVMVEIRSDLVSDAADAQKMAGTMAAWLRAAAENIVSFPLGEVG